MTGSSEARYFFEPRRYQREGAAAVERFGGRALLADDQGLGKTIEVLLWCCRNPEVRPVVIVCPAGAKYHWQRECRTKFGWDALVLNHTVPPPSPWTKRPDFVIINYDIISNSNDGGGKWLKVLQDLKPSLVVLDELQGVKEATAKRTKRCQSLCRDVPHLIGISGTPMLSKPIELWNFLSWCRPDVFDSHHDFVWEFCAPKHEGGGSWNYDGCSNPISLNRKLLKHLMIRRLKKDVLDQIPPKQVVMVPMGLSNVKEYNEAHNNTARWLESQGAQRLRSKLRAQELKRFGVLRRLAVKFKMPCVLSWLDDYLLDTDDKLLVGVIHRSTTAELMGRYSKVAVVVDGETPMKKRLDLFDRFNNDPGVRLLIGNLQAAGTVYSARAPAVAVVEFPWTPGDLNQFIDRAHGVGRGVEGRTTIAYLLAAHGTIEEKVLSVLDRKQATLSAVMDGGTTGEEMNTIALLEEAIRNGHC